MYSNESQPPPAAPDFLGRDRKKKKKDRKKKEKGL